MSDERRPGPPQQQIFSQLLRSPNFRIIYASGFGYKATPADVALTPITDIPVIGQGTVIPMNAHVQEVMIMLSLPAVKALARNLTAVVSEVEKYVGHIRVPKGNILDDKQIEAISIGLKTTEYEDEP
jgi:hypothetical protein